MLSRVPDGRRPESAKEEARKLFGDPLGIGSMPTSKGTVNTLVLIAAYLLPEDLGVERVGGAGDAGDDCKRKKGGQDRLHGYLLSSDPIPRKCAVSAG